MPAAPAHWMKLVYENCKWKGKYFCFIFTLFKFIPFCSVLREQLLPPCANLKLPASSKHLEYFLCRCKAIKLVSIWNEVVWQRGVCLIFGFRVAHTPCGPDLPVCVWFLFNFLLICKLSPCPCSGGRSPVLVSMELMWGDLLRMMGWCWGGWRGSNPSIYLLSAGQNHK